MRILLAVAAVLLLAGCGGSHSATPRDHVSAYLGRERAIVNRSQPALVAVHQALVDFSHHRSSPATAKQLARASATFARLGRELKAANPPPQAAKLNRLLLELVAKQASLTGELRSLIAFEPKFTAALRPVAAANTRARASLAAARTSAAVAAAVGTYRAAVERSLHALRPLDPPALERPLYEAQLQRLAALDAALGHLAAAAAANDAGAATRAEREVNAAAVSSDSRANQVAERDAVVAYDRSVAAIAKLTQQISAERDRLQLTLR